MAEQQLREPVASPHQIAAGVLTRAHEITRGFLFRRRDTHRRDLTESKQSREPLGIFGVALHILALAIAAGAILVVQGTRVAYNHRGIGTRLLAFSPSFRFGYSSEWYARQLLGTMLVFLAAVVVVLGFGWR